MIGFMAGAGIVVRNSIILVDFIEQRLREGMPLAEAVVDAGAVRFRPMLLTAMAVVVGASVILADPIFQGLAISLMAGEIASLLISRMAVPVLYFMANRPSLRPIAPIPAGKPMQPVTRSKMIKQLSSISACVARVAVLCAHQPQLRQRARRTNSCTGRISRTGGAV